jgi:SMC interacting uncharacterized protein involved in chromosome segregation
MATQNKETKMHGHPQPQSPPTVDIATFQQVEAEREQAVRELQQLRAQLDGLVPDMQRQKVVPQQQPQLAMSTGDPLQTPPTITTSSGVDLHARQQLRLHKKHTDELVSKLNETIRLVTAHSRDLEKATAKIDALEQGMRDLDASVKGCELERFEAIETDLNDFDRKIDDLESEVSSLRHDHRPSMEISELAQRVSALEAVNRNLTSVLTGAAARS